MPHTYPLTLRCPCCKEYIEIKFTPPTKATRDEPGDPPDYALTAPHHCREFVEQWTEVAEAYDERLLSRALSRWEAQGEETP